MAAGKKTSSKATAKVKAMKAKAAKPEKVGKVASEKVEDTAAPAKQEEAAEKAPAKTEEAAEKAPQATEGAAADEPAKQRKKAPRTKATRMAKAVAEGADADGEKGAKGPKGVIYVGSIPKGFYEPQMVTYFSQFGEVTNCRHSRSKKTNNSKGYAWVEFKELDVAKIAAETMNGYLLFGSKLKCHVVASDKVHPKLFKGKKGLRVKRNTPQRRLRAFRDLYNNRPTVEIDGEQLPCTTVGQAKRNRAEKKCKKLSKMLGEMGIDFDPAGALAGVAAPSSPKALLMKSLTKASPKTELLKAATTPPAMKLEAAAGKKRPAAKTAGKAAKKAKA